MAITVACSCGKSFLVKDEAVGKRTKCRYCGALLDIKESTELPSDDDRPEDQGHRLPVLWLGVGVFCVALIAGAIVLDGKMKVDWANEEVASTVQKARQAADQKQWDKALGLLREALGIARATKFGDAHKFMAMVEGAKANELVALRVEEARKAVDLQQWDEATRLLNDAIAINKATKIDEAQRLLSKLRETVAKQEAEQRASQEREREAEEELVLL